MLIKGITIAQAEEIARNLGISLNPDNGKRGNYIRVTLRPSPIRTCSKCGAETTAYHCPEHPTRRTVSSDKYRSINKGQFNYGRKKWAVCWHGHRDFMRAVYQLNPSATIKTAYATYRNADNFEATFEATGNKNVGSMMFPVYASEACDCGE